jgi:predicted secreted protein
MPVWLLNLICQAYVGGFVTQVETSYLIMMNNNASKEGLNVAMHEIAAVNFAFNLSENGYTQIKLESNDDGNLNWDLNPETKKLESRKFEIDIVATSKEGAKGIYEVKPVGKNFQNQLDKYSSLTGLLPGTPLYKPIKNIPIIGNYKMGIQSKEPGQASYYLYNSKGNVKSPEVNYQMANEASKWLLFAFICIALAGSIGAGALAR